MYRPPTDSVPRWMTVPTPEWPAGSENSVVPRAPSAAPHVWVHSRRRPPLFRLLPNALLLPYAIGLFLITWLPASQAGKVTGIVAYIARKIDPRVPFSVGYPILEFLANVALFVPLGLLLAWGWPRVRAWVIVLIGFVTTVTIECVQWGIPSRFPAISDIVSNTLGTAIGVGLVVLVVTVSARIRSTHAT